MILVASDTRFLLQNVLEDICCSKFARNVKYCSNVAQSAKKCVRVLKMQNGAPNSKKCSKGAQRNRERPTEDGVFFRVFYRNLALLLLRVLLLALVVLLQNKHTSLAENRENLISAQPRISAHCQGPKI